MKPLNGKTFSIKCTKRIFLTTALMLFSIAANAGVPEQLHYMVSPAGCQPSTSTDANKLQFINGAWRIDSNANNVTAKLVCPVNIYGNSGQFHNLQLWYRSRGNNPYSIVRATLKSRHRTSPGADIVKVVSSEDANTHSNAYKFINNFIAGNVGPFTGENYYVEVLLYRNLAQNPGDVAFTGMAIDIQ